MEALRKVLRICQKRERIMGMLLSFVPRNPAQGQQRAPIGEPAPVIIFPGVRYERVNGDQRASDGATENSAKPTH